MVDTNDLLNDAYRAERLSGNHRATLDPPEEIVRTRQEPPSMTEDEIIEKYGQKPPPDSDTRNPRIEFKGVTSKELATSDYAVNFLIEDTLAELQPHFIGGPLKTLKTLVAIDAAVSLATATPFLGVAKVPEAVRVGFMSGEGGLQVAQEYATRVADAHGFWLGNLDNLVWEDRLPQLSDMKHVTALENFLEHWELRVLFLDPIYLCMSGEDAGNLMKQGAILRYVNHVCVERGVTPAMLHHFTRASSRNCFDPPELMSLAWSGFAEFAGQWWLLNRRSPYNDEKPGEHDLWLRIGGRAGHTALHALDVQEGRRCDPDGRRWDVEVIDPQEARKTASERLKDERRANREKQAEADLEANRKTIVQVLTTLKRETFTAVRDASGLGPKRFGRAWASLVEDKSIVLAGQIQKANKQEYEAWELGDE